MQVRRLIRGSAPLLLALPHAGAFVPPDIKSRLTREALHLSDADWHLDRMMLFSAELGASLLLPTHARVVADLGRAQDDPRLCPLQSEKGAPLYQAGEEPDAVERVNRIAAYWLPWHEAREEELRRLERMHGRAVLCLVTSHDGDEEVAFKVPAPRETGGNILDARLSLPRRRFREEAPPHVFLTDKAVKLQEEIRNIVKTLLA